MAEDRQPDPADQPDDPRTGTGSASPSPTALGGSGELRGGSSSHRRDPAVTSRPTRSRPCSPRSAAAT